jgi:hypothetical protein
MKTEIICITDRSGSMNAIRHDVVGGYNRFINDQKAVPGEARMTFVQFDDLYERLYEGVAIETVPYLSLDTYVPRGSTALMDAIGRTLNEQGERIAREKWADKVIVTIITDGQENASVKFRTDEIREMITHAEQHGWSFVFLAANQDAFATAAHYGISAATTQNFVANAAGAAQAYVGMSNMTRSLRTQ